jgi:hypothetical protein
MKSLLKTPSTKPSLDFKSKISVIKLTVSPRSVLQKSSSLKSLSFQSINPGSIVSLISNTFAGRTNLYTIKQHSPPDIKAFHSPNFGGLLKRTLKLATPKRKLKPSNRLKEPCQALKEKGLNSSIPVSVPNPSQRIKANFCSPFFAAFLHASLAFVVPIKNIERVHLPCVFFHFTF